MQTRQRVSTGLTRRAEWEPREPRRSDRPSASEPFVCCVAHAASFLPASDDHPSQVSLRAPCGTTFTPFFGQWNTHFAWRLHAPGSCFLAGFAHLDVDQPFVSKWSFDHSRMRHQQVWNSRNGGHTVANFMAWGFGGEHLEQCQTRSRDAEGFRVHRTLSNTHSHLAACVRASTDFRRDFSMTGSAFGIGVVSHHLFSIFMWRPHRGRTLKTSLSSNFERVVSCLG